MGAILYKLVLKCAWTSVKDVEGMIEKKKIREMYILLQYKSLYTRCYNYLLILSLKKYLYLLKY